MTPEIAQLMLQKEHGRVDDDYISDYKTKVSCWFCRFFHGEDNEGGQCRRNSPTMLNEMIFSWAEHAGVQEMGRESQWPCASWDDWCGEFQQITVKDREWKRVLTFNAYWEQYELVDEIRSLESKMYDECDRTSDDDLRIMALNTPVWELRERVWRLQDEMQNGEPENEDPEDDEEDQEPDPHA